MIPGSTKVDSLSDLLHRSERFQSFILHPSADRLFNSRQRDPDGALIVHCPVMEECERPVGKKWCGIRHEAELIVAVRDELVQRVLQSGDLPFERWSSVGLASVKGRRGFHRLVGSWS